MLKKAAFLLGSSILIVMFLVVSCEDQEISQTKYLDLDNFNSLITDTDGESYTGEVTSFVTDSNEIVIKLKGTINKLYVLQKEETPDELNLNNEKSQIIYLRNALVINAVSSSQIYYLGVNNQAGEKIRHRVKTKVNLSQELFGYGLAQMDISDFTEYDFQKYKSVYQSLAKVSGKSIDTLMQECNSGGPGSSSCSYSDPSGGCSVSCNGGYYACCDTTGRKCVKDGPGETPE